LKGTGLVFPNFYRWITSLILFLSISSVTVRHLLWWTHCTNEHPKAANGHSKVTNGHSKATNEHPKVANGHSKA